MPLLAPLLAACKFRQLPAATLTTTTQQTLKAEGVQQQVANFNGEPGWFEGAAYYHFRFQEKPHLPLASMYDSQLVNAAPAADLMKSCFQRLNETYTAPK